MKASTSRESGACPRIAVIGGGITGLAAAHRITELLPQAELEIFEATDRLGGVLETVHRDGFLIERSADNFLTKLPAAVDLCRRLGIAGDLLTTDETRRRALVVCRGRLVRVPDGFFLMSPRKLWPLLTSPLLSLRGKARMLAEPFIPRGPDADESLASFARRRLGREVFERLVQPLVAGIYTADPEKLSMAATMPQYQAYEREHGSLLRATLHQKQEEAAANRTLPTGRFPEQSHTEQPDCIDRETSGPRYALFVAPRNGMSSLVDALAARLSPSAIHLSTKVTSIDQHDRHWLLETGVGNSSPQFDALILAIPAPAAARLVVRFDAELSRELAAIPYAGCAIVSFGFERKQIAHPLDAFGFVVPQIEGRRIIAGSFASLKFAGRAPADCVLVRVFVGGALQPELAELPDVDLRQLAIDELRELLGIAGEPLLADIARWPASMPQYHVGHLDRVSRIESLAARHAALALTGNAYHGVGIPQCIASGESAAERIAMCL